MGVQARVISPIIVSIPFAKRQVNVLACAISRHTSFAMPMPAMRLIITFLPMLSSTQWGILHSKPQPDMHTLVQMYVPVMGLTYNARTTNHHTFHAPAYW